MSSLARVNTNGVVQGFLCAALVAATCVVSAGPASAAQYRMLTCASNVGGNGFQTATNTASSQNPGGIFNFSGQCGASPDPAGENAFIRISENQSSGNAGVGAFGDVIWDTPAWVHFKTAGGYTREPNAFNDGWRARFWGVDFSN